MSYCLFQLVRIQISTVQLARVHVQKNILVLLVAGKFMLLNTQGHLYTRDSIGKLPMCALVPKKLYSLVG